MNNINISRATLNDLNALIDLRIDFLTELLGNPSPEIMEECRNSLATYFTQALSDGVYAGFLARSGERVVSTGGIVFRSQPGSFKNPSGKVGYIMNMYTIPEFRRKGLCSAILKALVEEGQQMGFTTFELHATKDGEHVYPKYDFKIHSEPTYRKYLVD